MLLAAARGGDERAFSRLIEPYRQGHQFDHAAVAALVAEFLAGVR